MIGIDTNVLVRYLAQDDPNQARKVDAFLEDRSLREGSMFQVL